MGLEIEAEQGARAELADGSEMSSLVVTGQAEGSETASLPLKRQAECYEEAAADTLASEGAADLCVAQTQKLAVSITGSTDDSGRTTRTTNLRPPDFGPTDLEALRPPDFGVLELSARSEE